MFIVAGFSPEQWARQVQKLQPLHSTVHVPPPPSCAHGTPLGWGAGGHHQPKALSLRPAICQTGALELQPEVAASRGRQADRSGEITPRHTTNCNKQRRSKPN